MFAQGDNNNFAKSGVARSHQAVWQWVQRLADSVPDPPTAQPSRVAVDETAVKINGEWSWLYAAIDLDTKLILDVALFGRHGTDLAAAFLHGLDEKHDLSDTVFPVEQLAGDLDPAVLVMPHTVNGMDYAPAIAKRLDRPLVTDAIDFSFDDRLTVTREMYGSKVETDIAIDADRCAVTIRPTVWPKSEASGAAAVEAFDADIDESAIKTTVTSYEETGGGDVDITDADILVSIGRGIEDKEDFDLTFDLAEALDATVSASRPIVDNRWLEANRQVGQSGKVVTPRSTSPLASPGLSNTSQV